MSVPGFPEKVTWYGEPNRLWKRIEETYELSECGRFVIAHRKILLRSSLERIVLRVDLAASTEAS